MKLAFKNFLTNLHVVGIGSEKWVFYSATHTKSEKFKPSKMFQKMKLFTIIYTYSSGKKLNVFVQL